MIKKMLEYFCNLWYSIFRIKGNCFRRYEMVVAENGTNTAIFDSKELACYVCDSYFKSYHKDISEIKLQKTMYFLFACWGGFIAKNESDEVEEKLDYSKYLYKTKIEAWVYGPVLPEIYRLHKRGELSKYKVSSKVLFKDKDFVKETIKSIMQDLFELSDFKLVSLSHEDNCWQNKFDVNDEFHNQEIELDSIISEYEEREAL